MEKAAQVTVEELLAKELVNEDRMKGKLQTMKNRPTIIKRIWRDVVEFSFESLYFILIVL